MRFGCYTGQDREEAREQILQEPSHILLTNYVMAEYIVLCLTIDTKKYSSHGQPIWKRLRPDSARGCGYHLRQNVY